MPRTVSKHTEYFENESKKEKDKRGREKTYYSLGIVIERDVKNGSFFPSYVLCQSVTTSDVRCGWRVVKQFDGKPKFNLPKVLVTSIYGHQDMIDYLSDYRTQDKLKGKHYYPKGALCWFSCDQYGFLTGSVYFIKQIPDMKLLDVPKNQRGYRRLKKQQEKIHRLNEILSKGTVDSEMIAVVKPKLHKELKGET